MVHVHLPYMYIQCIHTCTCNKDTMSQSLPQPGGMTQIRVQMYVVFLYLIKLFVQHH